MPNVVYRELAGRPVPTSSVAFVYRLCHQSPAASQLIKFARGYALPCDKNR
jgi:hypothetical protein